jgi:hypothetical protein
MARLPAPLALALVGGLIAGCSPTSTPFTSPAPASGSPPTPATATATASVSAAASPTTAPPPIAVPAPRVLAGPNVTRAVDAATDGSVIAWSSGSPDPNAGPELWVFEPATGRSRLIFRSAVHGAVLAGLAVRGGRYAFAEITPASASGVPGSGRWRLVVLDPAGRLSELDKDQPPEADPPERVRAVLPMVALSDRGILWAASHAAGLGDPTCLLQYASFADLSARVLGSAPCRQVEYWFPRSDGRSFVYGTVEYGVDRSRDDRHVYLLGDDDLTARRLDHDAQASLPDVLADTVIWKTADPEWNMLSFGELVEYSRATGAARTIPFLSAAPGDGRLTTPTIGNAFFAAEDEDSAAVWVWDRAGERAVEVDRLAADDEGFFSNVRLSADLLIWFYGSAAQGGGERQIRWLDLGPPIAQR